MIKQYRQLREICEFIQEDDRNSNIMDCYEEFEDGEMEMDTLVSICQRVLDEGREDWMNHETRDQYVKYTRWLGI